MFLSVLGASLCLSACDRISETAAIDGPDVPKVDQPPSPASLAAASYYAKVEQGHQARGILRLDGGGPDTPYDAERLSAAFTAVAFSTEFTDQGKRLVEKDAASRLHRWSAPVRVQPVFGRTVLDAQRAEDTASIERFATRLAQITRHPVSAVESNGNFHVLIVNEDERQGIGPTLSRLLPDIRPREIAVIENLDQASYCVVVTSDPQNNGVLTRAVAVIRAELPPVLRLSCIHEEIAQGLGLSNDSDTARPSIFNDDDEFARLTTMDEKMLRMLYDIRLKPGQDAESAAPTVAALARAMTAPAF